MTGKGWAGYQKKVLHQEVGQALEQAPHGTQPARVQEAFEQCSQIPPIYLFIGAWSFGHPEVGIDGPCESLTTWIFYDRYMIDIIIKSYVPNSVFFFFFP